MEMYEFDLKIKEQNPKCKLVGIKTDCLVYNNITKQPKTSNEWGDIKRCEVPKIHEIILNNEIKIRNERYELIDNEWNKINYSIEMDI